MTAKHSLLLCLSPLFLAELLTGPWREDAPLQSIRESFPDRNHTRAEGSVVFYTRGLQSPAVRLTMCLSSASCSYGLQHVITRPPVRVPTAHPLPMPAAPPPTPPRQDHPLTAQPWSTPPAVNSLCQKRLQASASELY